MDLKLIGRIIREKRESAGLTQIQFAERLKVRQSTVNRIENGANTTLTRLGQIAKIFDVPPWSLISPEPLVPKSYAQREPMVRVVDSAGAREDPARYGPIDDFIPIPILASKISLGPGIEISSAERQGTALIYRKAVREAWGQKPGQERVIGVFAQGESMEPTISDRSLIAIDLLNVNEIQNYKIYAVYLPDVNGVTVKRVVRRKDHLFLLADNRDEPDFPRCLKLDDLSFNPIRGKVIWAWNRLD